MFNIPVPYDRISFFLEELDISEPELDLLDAHRHVFTARKDDFGAYFHDFFYRIPRTRLILEYDKTQEQLSKILADWFEFLFRDRLNDEFLGLVWRSGLKHVEENVDQRYVNLGYSAARHFCHSIVESEITIELRQKIAATIDKMLDICVLIATDAYVTATTRCDLEVIKGVAHQVRNPITIIGGNILRLQRKVGSSQSENQVFESIIQETKRLERLVVDIGIYNEAFRVDPRFTATALDEVLDEIIQNLKDRIPVEGINIKMRIDPENDMIEADHGDMHIMFSYLLENSFEAVDLQNPYIEIASMEDVNQRFVRVEIFNTGAPPKTEDLQYLYTPFYSSKPTGTGFGLPIARMIARKNLGSLVIEPGVGEGTRCIVTLPKAHKA